MKLKTTIVLLLSCLMMGSLSAQDVIKLGIIGLDTSHSPAFIKMINGKEAPEKFKKFKIVAAYPYGSTELELSKKRIPGYIDEAKAHDVKITKSIDEMLKMVDFVFLETNDGNFHLEQAIEVFKAGKPVFIDKPVAATLPEAIAIFELAKKYNVPMFSASSLRYSPLNQEIREGKHGKVLGADCYSPHAEEASHSSYTWYGIHGVEILYTAMGQGCEEVSYATAGGKKGWDVVTGVWGDGRIGTFRAVKTGHNFYGGTVFCESKTVQAGGYAGYEVLLDQIIKFFETKVAPIDPEETLEMFVFMEASDESKRQGGAPVSMKAVQDKANVEARRIIKNLNLID